jgi:hypothetical protein
MGGRRAAMPWDKSGADGGKPSEYIDGYTLDFRKKKTSSFYTRALFSFLPLGHSFSLLSSTATNTLLKIFTRLNTYN